MLREGVHLIFVRLVLRFRGSIQLHLIIYHFWKW